MSRKQIMKTFFLASRSLLRNIKLFSTNVHNIPPEPIDFNKGFKLPDREDKTTLQILNSHPNDFSIHFDRMSHAYSYNGVSMEVSVTTFVESFFEKFIPSKVISKMMNGPNWPREGYISINGSPLTENQIKLKWEKQGEYSRNQGTWMHYNIENYINNLPANMKSKEMEQFEQFYTEYVLAPNIQPYRTEWPIAAPDIKLGGSVDFVGKLSNGNYVIMDWKRSKRLPENLTSKYGKFAKPPIDHLDDCEGSKYSLQLNLYKYILETHYGLHIEAMKLVSLHPSLEKPAVVDVPPLQSEIRSMVEHYLTRGLHTN